MILDINSKTLLTALERISNVEIKKVRIVNDVLIIDCGTAVRHIACEYSGSTIWYDADNGAWRRLAEVLHHLSEQDVRLEIKQFYLDLIIAF